MAPDDDVRRSRFARALASLSDLFDPPPSAPPDVLRDARVQRFELTFEALWKVLQSLAAAEGLEAGSPRKALTAALRLGLVLDDEQESAWRMLRYRNLTVHTYDEELAQDLERFLAEEGVPLLQAIARRIDEA